MIAIMMIAAVFQFQAFEGKYYLTQLTRHFRPALCRRTLEILIPTVLARCPAAFPLPCAGEWFCPRAAAACCSTHPTRWQALHQSPEQRLWPWPLILQATIMIGTKLSHSHPQPTRNNNLSSIQNGNSTTVHNPQPPAPLVGHPPTPAWAVVFPVSNEKHGLGRECVIVLFQNVLHNTNITPYIMVLITSLGLTVQTLLRLLSTQSREIRYIQRQSTSHVAGVYVTVSATLSPLLMYFVTTFNILVEVLYLFTTFTLLLLSNVQVGLLAWCARLGACGCW